MAARLDAISIFNAAVQAVQPHHLLPQYLHLDSHTFTILDRRFSLKSLPAVYVIGAGKASAAMAQAIETVIADLITGGIIVTKYEHALSLEKIKCVEAGHPVPDQQGLRATEATIALLKKVKENDIVISLISGGASSLWIDLPEKASLNDVQQTFNLLLKSGADIEEINTVRKHLSSIKGGQLLQFAPNANWFSLIISDVPGDDLSVIASGPTVADKSTFQDVMSIIEKYKLSNRLPETVINYIIKGCEGNISETIKPGNKIFEKVQNKIIGSNAIALKTAAEKAKQSGYYIALTDDNLTGDAETMAKKLMSFCANYSGPKPACILLGGETTVTVAGSGKGGRNQHMALSALAEIIAGNHKNKITFLSAGTDGTDGPTDAAGAIADDLTVSIAKSKNLNIPEYLTENDAYHFFEQTGGLLITGPTQTNVMDLIIVLIEENFDIK